MKELLIYLIPLLLGAFAIATAVGVALGLVAYLSERQSKKEKDREYDAFLEALQDVILSERTRWQDIKMLAEHYEVDLQGVRDSLLELVADNFRNSAHGNDRQDVQRQLLLCILLPHDDMLPGGRCRRAPWRAGR